MHCKKLQFADITHSKVLVSRAIFKFHSIGVYLDIQSFLSGLTHMKAEQAVSYSNLAVSVLNEGLFEDHF